MVDEAAINDMSFIFFEDVLEALGHKLQYDAVVNYAGNSFMEKSWEIIMEHNPFQIYSDHKPGGSARGLVGFFQNAELHIAGG